MRDESRTRWQKFLNNQRHRGLSMSVPFAPEHTAVLKLN